MSVLNYLEETVKKHAQKTAIRFRDEHVSFFELRFLAKKLAAKLCAVQNQPIGVFANRSVTCGILFLAVLYSGNFYVPLDPDMPDEKLKWIISEAKFSYILGEENNRETISRLRFDGNFLTIADRAAECICESSIIQEKTPMYMVYTSGSTGKPKGVLKSHGAMKSYIEAFCDTFPFTAEEVIGNQTPFFFDASAKDFYLMLKTGATLEILPTEFF